MPDIAVSEMVTELFGPFAKDHVELTDGVVSVNWDVEEMEKYKVEIVEKKLLQTSWLSILFCLLREEKASVWLLKGSKYS
ncbi:hypothetical protein ACMFMG_006864 [Clarireedia jacksonii]